MKLAVMNDENRASAPTSRITRARAKSLGSSSGLPPLHPSAKQDDKRRAGLKRRAPENELEGSSAASPQPKKRAVLTDVTNIKCDDLTTSCINAARCLVILLPLSIVEILYFFILLCLSPTEMMSLASS